MLHTITQPNEYLLSLIKDDPVRPEIPLSDRVNENSRIYVWKNGEETAAADSYYPFILNISGFSVYVLFYIKNIEKKIVLNNKNYVIQC